MNGNENQPVAPGNPKSDAVSTQKALPVELEFKRLLDWAEAIMCNGIPMGHCAQSEWDAIVLQWRDAKHAVSPDGPERARELDRERAKALPVEAKRCGNYSEHGFGEDGKGCAKPEGHEGNCGTR